MNCSKRTYVRIYIHAWSETHECVQYYRVERERERKLIKRSMTKHGKRKEKSICTCICIQGNGNGRKIKNLIYTREQIRNMIYILLIIILI